jgi:hypothetical protein
MVSWTGRAVLAAGCCHSLFGVNRTNDTGAESLSNSVFRQCPVCGGGVHQTRHGTWACHRWDWLHTTTW